MGGDLRCSKMKQLAFVLLAACAGPVPQASIREPIPIAVVAELAISVDSLERFTARIQRDAARWDDGLEARDCTAAFRFVELGAEDMRIVLRRDHWDDLPANGGGYFDGRDVLIHADPDGTWDSLADKDSVIIAQHELGHALGLPHNMRDDSVMSTVVYAPVSEGDIDDAEASIGCR